MEVAPDESTKTMETVGFHPNCRQENVPAIKGDAVRVTKGKRRLARDSGKGKRKKRVTFCMQQREAVRLSKGKRVLARDLGGSKREERVTLKNTMDSSNKAGVLVDLSDEGDGEATVQKAAGYLDSLPLIIVLSDDSDGGEVVPKRAKLSDSGLDVIQLSDDSDDEGTPAATTTTTTTTTTTAAAAAQLVDLGTNQTFHCVGPSLSR